MNVASENKNGSVKIIDKYVDIIRKYILEKSSLASEMHGSPIF